MTEIEPNEPAVPEEISSIFDVRSIEEIYSEIRDLYLSDHRPWIVGYSGGKDSTTVVQLIWNALKSLTPEQRTKQVYVISSDTLVETPVIIDTINGNLDLINKAAQEQGLPIQAVKLYPKIENSFWVLLIGKGYPTPSKSFRWCTDRLKIKTSDTFILDKVSEHGEVVLVLGVRKSESSARAQLMNLYKIKGSLLSRHSKFAQSFVYTPIEDFSKDDVWTYLLQNPNPWSGSNRDLLALYKSADSGECPLVVDEYSPPCGNSRFGCWVCTVVTKDKAIMGLIDSGEEWLEPLLKYRDMLAETQDKDKKPIFRDYKRMNGKIKYKKDGSGELIRGPYKSEYCKQFLKELLETQREIQKIGPNPNLQLILPEELHEIRRIWRQEKGDWEDSVPKIYREVMGTDLDWVQDDLEMFSSDEGNLLEAICRKHDVPVQLVAKLLDVERQVQGMKRRAAVYSRIEDVLGEEWRTEEEITKR
ncbi:DNA phosphorothioation system sulfurtransferase DndC [Methanoculleus sp.]|jgi:DNA sulfur modification protein DndC|uniref:DNA phosphorothioation system sulfurtransferase DndC n=1 Tax=Methanoculleus sp. TaxID=90427 RepID=UPI001BD6A5C8|nr:DNA phosphorothioation system sulfurtransferase DndC [Methanoculleus sp.]